MRYRIIHVTSYDYSDPVSLCHNMAHLKLRSQPGQRPISSQVRVEPPPAVMREQKDYFDNHVTYFCVQQAHHRLTVTAVSEVEVQVRGLPEDSQPNQPWEGVRDQLQHEYLAEDPDIGVFFYNSPFIKLSRELASYALVSFTPKRPYLQAVQNLMSRIYTEFTYDPQATDVATPLEQVLAQKRGVCQDFAHLAIGCLRSIGIPSRYVSGYLETLPPPGKPKLRGADASHAWFSVMLPGAGWLDFDPTNNAMPEEQHITTAVGRDFGDVTPVKGVLYGGGENSLTVTVDVERLNSES